MENAMINQAQKQMLPNTEIEILEKKIIYKTKQAQRMALEYAIEIGGYLTEAKSLVPHGEWGKWLKERVNYSQSTAINFMKAYEEYGNSQESLFSSNSQTLMNLSYTKALRLLAIPEEEREQFVEENNVENLSSRELDRLIKERDEAVAKAEKLSELETQKEDAERNANYHRDRAEQLAEKTQDLEIEIENIRTKLQKAKEAEKKAKTALKELKENPEIPQEVSEKLKAEAEAKAAADSAAEIEKLLADANEKIEAANLAKKAAEKDAAKAQHTADELKKQLQMSNPDVAAFKALFISAQENLRKLKELLDRITAADSQLGQKLGAAMNAAIKNYEV